MLEKLAPTHKLTQRLQVIFDKTNAVKEAVTKQLNVMTKLEEKSACGI